MTEPVRFNADVYDELDEGERHLVDWQYNMTGGFYAALWKAMTIADGQNLSRIGIGFPLEVRAYENFSRVPGWWPELQARLIAVEMKGEQHE